MLPGLTQCAAQPLTCVIAAVDATNAEPSEIASQIAIMQSVAEKNNLFKRYAFIVIDGKDFTVDDLISLLNADD